MKLIDLFDRVYVLNLPERVDRREMTITELKSIDILLEPGRVEIFPAIKPTHAEPFHRLGSKGCFLSTLSMLKQARAEGAGNVLIFQDDIQFTDHFRTQQEKLVHELDQIEWDIVQFGFYGSDYLFSPANADSGNFRDFTGEVIGAHFFGVNGKTLDRLIEFLEGLLQRPRGHASGGPMPIDGAFNVFRWQNPDTVRLLALPVCGDQRSSRSDCSPKWFDKIHVLKEIANSYRARVLK